MTDRIEDAIENDGLQPENQHIEAQEETEETLDSSMQEETAEDKKKEKPSKEEYIDMTLQSLVLPLEMRFSQINHSFRKLPRAYRSYTFINSVIEGVISPERYSFAADLTERGVRISKWNISGAIGAVRKFKEAGRHIDFVTARVSPQLVREEDFYGYIKEIFEENGFNEYDSICLEFPKTVLYEDTEKVRMALLSLKLLKVRSLMSGCGDRDNPVTKLFELPFDYVLLSPWLIDMADDRERSGAMESLIGYFHGLGCGVIADGVRNDKQISVLSRADCYGYIPSPGYSGEIEHGRLRMPLDEAVLQQEEDI